MATAKQLLDFERSQLGIKETPAGSNNVRYNTDYYGRAVSGDSFPWCCAFQWDAFRLCGASSLFYGGTKTAYCPAMQAYAETHGQWVTSGFQPGDLILFDFHGGGRGLACHIGMLERVVNGTYICLEGNTSVTSDDNGGAVMRRTRYRSQILGAYRPKYAADTAETEDDDMDISKLTDAQVLALGDRYAALLAERPTYSEAAAAMARAAAAGIMDGKRPCSVVTRGELAITMDRAELLKVKK